jgi:predicted NUDIX family NTP pyrophosphohydrolase
MHLPLRASEHAYSRAKERLAMSRVEFEQFLRLCALKGPRRQIAAKHDDGEMRMRYHWHWGVIVASIDRGEVVTVFPNRRMKHRKPPDRARAAWKEVGGG